MEMIELQIKNLENIQNALDKDINKTLDEINKFTQHPDMDNENGKRLARELGTLVTAVFNVKKLIEGLKAESEEETHKEGV
tara:strand:+ start:203 stop:445 length:243 start_codon:yes stop_codon:yes gene_type:complete